MTASNSPVTRNTKGARGRPLSFVNQFTAFPGRDPADFDHDGLRPLQDVNDFDLPPDGHARRALRLFYGLIGCPELADLDEEAARSKAAVTPATPPEE